MKIVPFNPLHLSHIEMQEDQAHGLELFKDPNYHALLLMGEAYTAYDESGRIVVIAGVFPLTDYMGRAWALLSKHIKPSMLYAHREIFRFLYKSDYVRIDTPVRRGFSNGHRWCKLLGFVNETPEHGMKYYGYDGLTYDLYAIFPKELNHGQAEPLQIDTETGHQRH